MKKTFKEYLESVNSSSNIMKKAYKDTEEESEELYSKIISKTRVNKEAKKEAIDRLIKKLEEEHHPGIIRSVLDYKDIVSEELRKYIIDKLKEKDLYDIVFPTKEAKKEAIDRLIKKLEEEHHPGIIRSVLDKDIVSEKLRKYIIDKLKEKDLYDIVFPIKEV